MQSLPLPWAVWGSGPITVDPSVDQPNAKTNTPRDFSVHTEFLGPRHHPGRKLNNKILKYIHTDFAKYIHRCTIKGV